MLVLGVLQAFTDGLKLFAKRFFTQSNNLELYFCGCFCLGSHLPSLGVIPYGNLFMDLHLGILCLLQLVCVYTKCAFDGAMVITFCVADL